MCKRVIADPVAGRTRISGQRSRSRGPQVLTNDKKGAANVFSIENLQNPLGNPRRRTVVKRELTRRDPTTLLP